MKPSEVLRNALELMNDTGAHWTQGAWTDLQGPNETPRYCSVGAINATVHNEPLNYLLREEALKALAYGLPTPGPKGPYAENEMHKVIKWNDNPRRKWADIVARFEKAIARLESERQ